MNTQVVTNNMVPQRDDGVDTFQRILCAVDFSPASTAAVAAAFAVARDFDARVTLVHVIERFPHEPVYSGGRAVRLVSEYESRIAQLERRLRALIPRDVDQADHDVLAVSGSAHAAVLAVAQERDSDLIVLGMSGHGRFERAIVGSTVKAIVGQARCAVLVVPKVREGPAG